MGTCESQMRSEHIQQHPCARLGALLTSMHWEAFKCTDISSIAEYSQNISSEIRPQIWSMSTDSVSKVAYQPTQQCDLKICPISSLVLSSSKLLRVCASVQEKQYLLLSHPHSAQPMTILPQWSQVFHSIGMDAATHYYLCCSLELGGLFWWRGTLRGVIISTNKYTEPGPEESPGSSSGKNLRLLPDLRMSNRRRFETILQVPV